ncbi:lysozyme [Klebsiella phage YX3973]|mgnify:FL=1|jgi:lysozyme|uniref:endolysin n=1 Tax=Klebsiella phage YX3973 TaxID=2500166 RepID=UPI001018DB5D|nr:endolysin [Klebsiella phage YX3973]QAX91980.1 lysozyme [Klebsiella phage YX3973]
MKLSQRGIDLIKQFEGYSSKAYPDPATGGAPWTIGYGTIKGVKPGMIITAEQAEKMLRDDVAKFESGVSSLITAPTTQGQFDAMVSLAYNIGLGNFGKSTLLKKHNARCYTCAADQFRVWNRANGKVMNGLTKRRAAERQVYMS